MKIHESRNKMLLIAPLFFGYYKEMVKEAEELGYEVDYVCDAPNNSNLSKALGRVNKKLIQGATKKYFRRDVLPGIKQKTYDCVLLVGGMTFSFTPQMVGAIRELNPQANFVMYQWDSEKNLPYAAGIHKYFDRVYSFDRHDCMAKKMYTFLPLFYTRSYENIGGMHVQKKKYDCSYVGTAHPKKYHDINEMAQALEEQMPKQLVFHYMPSILKYCYHKLSAPEFKGARKSDFTFTKVPIKELLEIIADSKCVLDAPQAGQTGLTIRSIECLGAKRKLITTNADIRFYDFYREENILIFDGKIDETSAFFKSGYVDLPQEIYEKYSLRNWLKMMICEGKSV